MHWGSFFLGVAATLCCIPVAYVGFWAYCFFFTDWDTGHFVPPRWLSKR